MGRALVWRRDIPTALFFALGVAAAMLLAAGATVFSAAAQAIDESSFIFDDSGIPTVRIEMSDADFNMLFAPGNEFSDEELPASFQFERDGRVFDRDSVGFRLRGNTSRTASKKSFKVSFNTFRKGADFFGIEKLNLNGEHNDPTLMRAKVSWDLFNRMGLPASRANHVKLYINGSYYGVYVNVEHVDEKFLARHYGGSEGNLYKCLWPADLTYLGSTADDYRPVDDSRRPYDLKLKEDDLLGYQDLADFISVLNLTDATHFENAIEQVFDVNGFLRSLAVTVLLGSWDSYWFLKNNYYLYFDPRTSKFEYIPFDFDNDMGIWWDGILPGVDWTTRDIYQWGHPSESRPLTERVLSIPQFRDRYTFYLKKVLQDGFDRSVIEPRALSLKDSIAGPVAQDPYRPLDYGFSMQDFDDSYFGALSAQAHVVEGLLPFIENRSASAWAQLDRIDIAPIISDLTVSPGSVRRGGAVNVSVRVEDEEVDRVELHHWLGSPVENIVTMLPDPSAGADRFSGDFVALSDAGFVDFRVEAYDATGQKSVSRLRTLEVRETVPLYINEFMAANDGFIRDPANELDDWIELYNGGSSDLNLNGLFLTDTLGIPMKWALPDTTIPAGQYLLVWADEDGMQGPTHANFRLSRDGEVVAIFDDAGAMIDSVSFGPQMADVSYGRLPDGADSFASFISPTPGSSNGTAIGSEEPAPAAAFRLSLFPNPFRDRITLEFSSPLEHVRFRVYDLLGRLIADVKQDPVRTTRIDWLATTSFGTPLSAGIYVVKISGRMQDREEVFRAAAVVNVP